MIKLNPTPEADARLRQLHADDCADRKARGLRPLSLSNWIMEQLAKLWEVPV